jgi:hypothetical protein
MRLQIYTTKELKKLAHQECHISNQFQQILSKKGKYCICNQILEGILNFKF